MSSSSPTQTLSDPRTLLVRRSRLAILALFAVDGIGFGMWAAFLPTFKTKLALSDSGLSIPLFAMVTGSLASMPVAGRFVGLRGSRGVVLVSAIGYCGILPLLALAASYPGGLASFTLAALVYGAAKGALDVSANAQAIEVERAGGRPIVSACHGSWSLGLLCGSASTAICLELRLPPPTAMLLVGLSLLGVVWIAGCHLRTDDQVDATTARQATIWPRGRLIPIAMLAFFALFCEGAMGDWSAVYLAGEVGVTASSAALGYAGYALAMTVGRFAGDGLVARLGPATLLRASALFVAAGLGAALALRTYPAALIGFALVGLGLANMVPILFRSAGRDPGAGGAIASVSTVGYLGFLIGPPVIGALSEVVGLSLALAVVVAFGLVIAGSARFAAERIR